MDEERPIDASLLLSVIHGERTAQRILTVVGGRGHEVTGFRYHLDAAARRGLVVLTIAGCRDVPRLAVQLERLVDVDRCQPFTALLGMGGGSTPLYVERFDLRVKTDAGSRPRHEALLAARIAGHRQLGVGEADDEVEALARCFAALPSVEAHGGAANPEVVIGRIGSEDLSYAWIRLTCSDKTHEVLRAGASPLLASVHALAAAYAELLEPHLGPPVPVTTSEDLVPVGG